MPKNLLDVLKGTLGGGAGIKGDWDCTPTVGADFAIVDSFRATYNAETKVATADWSGISTVTPGTPYIGMLKTDLTLGSISLNEVKKLSLQITADLTTPTAMVYVGAFFLDSNTYSAETAATMFFNMLVTNTPLPKPNIYTVGLSNPINDNHGIAVSSAISAVTDDFPSGMIAVSTTLGNNYVDTASAGVGDNLTLFLSRTPGALPEDAESINVASAIFDSTGTMLSAGYLGELPGNPVLSSGMTMYIGLLGMTMGGSVLPPVSIGTNISAGPNTATLSDIIFTSGSLGFTQDDWDLLYPSPATPFIPINQAVFPQGAKKNDQFRVKIQAPATQATPYGTVVTPESVVVVDNVNAGQEAFRVLVDSSVLEARLAQLDFSTQIGSLTALVDEAGRRSGEMVFYVRSSDPALDPLVGPGIYDSFELAYEAASLQPRHIRKYIVIDDRSTNYRPTITFKTTGDGTWYLAANNIELSTIRTFDKIVDPAQVPTGQYPYYFNEVVDVRGRFDALHFSGGAWAIAHGRDYNSSDCFCVPSSPSTMVETPSGMRRALEMGDNTNVMLSPLSYNLNWWDESVLHVGNNCTLMIFTDVSQAAMYADPGVMQAFPYIYNYDGHHATPGRVTGKNGMTTIYGGNNFSLYIGYGSPENGVASFPLTIRTPALHGTIDFNDLTGCTHEFPGAVNPSTADNEEISRMVAGAPSDNITIIRSKEDFSEAAQVPGGEIDSYSTRVYTFVNGTYVIAGQIILDHNEAIAILGDDVRFYGLDNGTASYLYSNNSNGFIGISASATSGCATFTNLLLTSLNGGSPMFRTDMPAVPAESRFTFNNCKWNAYSGMGARLIPEGSGGVITYNDCKLFCGINFATAQMPSGTLGHTVRFNNLEIFDGSLVSGPRIVFDFSGKTISAQHVFKNCHIRKGVNMTVGAKAMLIATRSTTTAPHVAITIPSGLVVDNCTKHWDVPGYNYNSIILGSYKSIPNFIFHDYDAFEEMHHGKKVVNVYNRGDLPTNNAGEDYVVLPANTIFKIHGNITIGSILFYMSNGTEIIGNAGDMTDALSFGILGSYASLQVALVSEGDNTVLRNIRINCLHDASNQTGLQVCANTNTFASSAIGSWKTGKPIILDNVIFSFYNPSGNTNNVPVRFAGPESGDSYRPDISIGNVFTDDQATYDMVVVGGYPGGEIENIECRNITTGFPTGTWKRAQLKFGNEYWRGRVTIRDCDLSEPPITISAWGVAALTAANRVTAFNNRGVDAAGTYGNALTTYVDGILMSNATLMLAQGNILGAPNSP